MQLLIWPVSNTDRIPMYNPLDKASSTAHRHTLTSSRSHVTTCNHLTRITTVKFHMHSITHLMAGVPSRRINLPTNLLTKRKQVLCRTIGLARDRVEGPPISPRLLLTRNIRGILLVTPGISQAPRLHIYLPVSHPEHHHKQLLYHLETESGVLNGLLQSTHLCRRRNGGESIIQYQLKYLDLQVHQLLKRSVQSRKEPLLLYRLKHLRRRQLELVPKFKAPT